MRAPITLPPHHMCASPPRLLSPHSPTPPPRPRHAAAIPPIDATITRANAAGQQHAVSCPPLSLSSRATRDRDPALQWRRPLGCRGWGLPNRWRLMTGSGEGRCGFSLYQGGCGGSGFGAEQERAHVRGGRGSRAMPLLDHKIPPFPLFLSQFLWNGLHHRLNPVHVAGFLIRFQLCSLDGY